jgi:hypothetical protein
MLAVAFRPVTISFSTTENKKLLAGVPFLAKWLVILSGRDGCKVARPLGPAKGIAAERKSHSY